MKVFVFNHPVPFPESEYGGLWVIVAEDGAQAAELALLTDTFQLQYHIDRLHKAIAAGRVLETEQTEPHVVANFIT